MFHPDWRWFGTPGHFICADHCRFHLCTQIGDYLVSTVGEYVPDMQVCEVLAKSRGIILKGKGEKREADWMRKAGYENIGAGRKYETMVFRISHICTDKDCDCGMPIIALRELECVGYNSRKEANQGHYDICLQVAEGKVHA